MLTIDQLGKIDNLATSIIAAMHRFIARMGHKYEDFLVNTTYRVAEAKAAARAEALAEVGSKLVSAEIRAAAAGRLEAMALDALISALDARRFITDEGEPDRDAIAAFIEGIAPKPQDDGRSPLLDLGQGARGGDNPSAALNGDPLLNSVKAKLGIR